MNDPTPSLPTSETGPVDEAELCAAFVLDASGRIVAVNRSGRQLLGASDRPLVGLPFAGFFRLRASPTESESPEAQWESLRTATLDHWSALTAQPMNGPPHPAQVRIERAFGGAGTYIATVLPR